MKRKSPSSRPQNRGLITAVALFSIAVLAGLWWATKQPGLETSPMSELPIFGPDQGTSRERGHRRRTAADGGETRGDVVEDARIRQMRASGAVVGSGVALRGDVIQLEGKVFRLVDINEFAGYTHCGPSDFQWRCGTSPKMALNKLLKQSFIGCFDMGVNAEGLQLGQCFLDGTDIGGWMVNQGMAAAASNRFDYRFKQGQARDHKRGYWFAHVD